ncbi:MAG: hypothetical protein JNL92_23105 [Opitutaceae bacterium]|nr:hypothetical protein [Opitutaceae bacterium]
MNQTKSTRPKISSRHRMVRLQASEARSEADQAESVALAAKADYKRARKAYKQAKKAAKAAKKRLKELVRKLKKIPPSKVKRPGRRSSARAAEAGSSGAVPVTPPEAGSGPAPASPSA